MRGIIGLIALLACLVSFGCKQGEGDRCQVVGDCADGLECVGPTDNKTCERSGGGGSVVDAAPEPDAEIAPDAMPVPDAAPAVDAEPATDAETVDAALPDAT